MSPISRGAALARAALAGTACLAVLTAGSAVPAQSLVHSAPTAKVAKPDAAKAGKKVAVTRFGYNATVYGTKVLLSGVEVRTLKDALINRPCTRRVGIEQTAKSLVSTSLLPEEVQEVVSLSLNTSNTETYHDKARGIYGVRGTSVLGDIGLGGNLGGVEIPRIVIQGLKSTADSFFDTKANGGKGAFKTNESFKYQGLKLLLPEGNPVSDTLQTLFDALGVDTDDVYEVVNVPVATLVDTLVNLVPGGVITIPGLGEIALGTSTHKITRNSASSEAYALRITLENAEAGLSKTTLQLGRATSAISRPVTAGVFRSKMSALEANIGGLLKVGGVGQRTLPCEGTNGKTVTQKVLSAGVPGILGLSGIEYKYKGVQQGKKANGFVQTTIGKVQLGTADVVIEGITSRVDLLSKTPNSRVVSKASTKIGRLLINGEEVNLLPGQKRAFQDATGQQGFIQRAVLSDTPNTFFGKHLTGLRLTLPGTNTTIDLAVANGEVFFR